jgi:hypothetical protein
MHVAHKLHYIYAVLAQLKVAVQPAGATIEEQAVHAAIVDGLTGDNFSLRDAQAGAFILKIQNTHTHCVHKTYEFNIIKNQSYNV